MIWPLPLINKEDEKYLHFCRWCGKELYKSNQRYCSKEHAESWRNNVLWEDAFWLQRPLALKRDNNSCQHCGKEKGYKYYEKSIRTVVNLHVHHKLPRCMGGSNKIDNLITLCEECHKEAHKVLKLPMGS